MLFEPCLALYPGRKREVPPVSTLPAAWQVAVDAFLSHNTRPLSARWQQLVGAPDLIPWLWQVWIPSLLLDLKPNLQECRLSVPDWGPWDKEHYLHLVIVAGDAALWDAIWIRMLHGDICEGRPAWKLDQVFMPLVDALDRWDTGGTIRDAIAIIHCIGIQKQWCPAYVLSDEYRPWGSGGRRTIFHRPAYYPRVAAKCAWLSLHAYQHTAQRLPALLPELALWPVVFKQKQTPAWPWAPLFSHLECPTGIRLC